MTYQEIKDVIEKYPYYKFPIQADDKDGNRIVINEGYRTIQEENVMKDVHYYKVYTYIGNQVNIDVYCENGIHWIELN